MCACVAAGRVLHCVVLLLTCQQNLRNSYIRFSRIAGRDPPKTGNSNALKGAAKASPKKKNAPQAAEKIEENKVTEEKDSPQEPPPPSGQVVLSEEEGPVYTKIIHCKPGSPGYIIIQNRIKNKQLAERENEQLAEKIRKALLKKNAPPSDPLSDSSDDNKPLSTLGQKARGFQEYMDRRDASKGELCDMLTSQGCQYY